MSAGWSGCREIAAVQLLPSQPVAWRLCSVIPRPRASTGDAAVAVVPAIQSRIALLRARDGAAGMHLHASSSAYVLLPRPALGTYQSTAQPTRPGRGRVCLSFVPVRPWPFAFGPCKGEFDWRASVLSRSVDDRRRRADFQSHLEAEVARRSHLFSPSLRELSDENCPRQSIVSLTGPAGQDFYFQIVSRYADRQQNADTQQIRRHSADTQTLSRYGAEESVNLGGTGVGGPGRQAGSAWQSRLAAKLRISHSQLHLVHLFSSLPLLFLASSSSPPPRPTLHLDRVRLVVAVSPRSRPSAAGSAQQLHHRPRPHLSLEYHARCSSNLAPDKTGTSFNSPSSTASGSSGCSRATRSSSARRG
jgi:hypothetical protein